MPEINSIEDLVIDEENLNNGSVRADSIIERSMQTLGAGRSILGDKNGKIIAGNHVLQKAQELGFEIEVIHTNGTRLVVVIRDDLDLDTDAKARELSIADNRASEVGLDWRMQKMQELVQQKNLKIDWLFTQKEIQAKLARQLVEQVEGGKKSGLEQENRELKAKLDAALSALREIHVRASLAECENCEQAFSGIAQLAMAA